MKTAGKLILFLLASLAAAYGLVLSASLLFQGISFFRFWLESDSDDKSGGSCLVAALANWVLAGVFLWVSRWLWRVARRIVGWRQSKPELPCRFGAGP